MCFKFLKKFFGGSSRRCSNAVNNGGASQRPSLDNVPQVSLDTVRTNKSAKSLKLAKSANSSKSGGRAVAAAQLAASVSSMESEQAVSGGGVISDTNAINASGSDTEKRGTWWGYFMGNKKKSSNEGEL